MAPATLAHAIPAFVLGIAFLVAGLGLAALLVRAARRSYIVFALLQWGFAVLFGVGGLAAGTFFIWFGVLVARCPPGAFECPF
jgi:hypothetical protein